MEDASLVYNIVNYLLIECWKNRNIKISSSNGAFVLRIAFEIIDEFLKDKENNVKQQILYSLLSGEWSKICINFTIAGNLEDAEDDERKDLRQRLKLYKSLSDKNITNLQSNKVSNIITQIIANDSKNVETLIKCCLFSKLFQTQYKLRVLSFTKCNNKERMYMNESIWIGLLHCNIDPWSYPQSAHKIFFQMYQQFAIWDHIEKYDEFRNPNNGLIKLEDDFNNNQLKEFLITCNKWKKHIIKYFDIIACHIDISQSIMVSQPIVIKFIVSSYLLSSNKIIKTKLDEIMQNTLNKEILDEMQTAKFVDKSLSEYKLPELFKHLLFNRQKYLHLFDPDVEDKGEQYIKQQEIKGYNQFTHDIADGVISAIKKVENNIQILKDIYTLNFSSAQIKIKYYMSTKEHIISIIANIFSFIDLLRSNNMKWKQRSIDNTSNNIKRGNTKLMDQTFSQIIFSSTKQEMNNILKFIFEAAINCFGELERNKYFDSQKQERMDNLANILSFLGHHWTHYVYPSMKDILSYPKIFYWFKALKFTKIGKAWINLLNEIIKHNGTIKDKLNNFIKENKINTQQLMNKYFDESNLSQYHEKDRNLLNNLFSTNDVVLPIKLEYNNNNNTDTNKERNVPLKKKKKAKQAKISQYYSSQTPGGPEDDDNNDEDEEIVIEPFTILDKQLYEDSGRLMYNIDYTDASRSGPDWKYKQDIIKEFGTIGTNIITKYDKENKDKIVEIMWGVDKIKDQKMHNGKIHYLVLWSNNDETWEPAENLTDCQEAIADFKRLQSNQKKKQRKEAGKKRIRAIQNSFSLVFSFFFCSLFFPFSLSLFLSFPRNGLMEYENHGDSMH